MHSEGVPTSADGPSLSKGIFLHKKLVSKKIKKQTSVTSHESWHLTRESFYSLWASLEKEIKTIQTACYTTIVQDVVHFVQNSCKDDTYSLTILNAVPTAALIMGVNMPDHSSVFSLLENQIHKSVTPYVARVQSKDCSTLANMMQRVVSSIVEKKKLEEDAILLKRHNCTFETLFMWYQQVVKEKECPSPSKRAKKAVVSREKQPIVIMIEDMESFKSIVLQDFILICSNYVQRLPLVLVLGIATAMVAVHNLLPQRATSCLVMETFSSAPATEYLGQVLQKVVMNPVVAFKLGPKVFQFLVDVTLFHDFSLSNLHHVLKLTVLEHFYSKKTSVLCCPFENIKSIVNGLSKDVIEALKDLPSVKEYFSQIEPEKFELLKDNRAFLTEVMRLLEELHNYQMDQQVLLECLVFVVADIPGYPLGKQVREIYVHILALEKSLNESPEYQKTFKLLSMLSREELENRLQKCVQVLKSSKTSSKAVPFRELLKTMEGLIAKRNKIDTEGDKDDEKEESTPINFGKRVSRSELKEKLKDLASKKKKTSKFELWRQEIISCWDEMFSHIKSPLSFPLHEVYYFTDVSVLKRHILASPKATIHKTLTDPQACLKCNCCKIDGLGDVETTMPPIAIAYKLHLECGNLINIYDWMQAYQAVKSTRGRKKETTESVHQAEFFQAMAELQLLGIIKSTKRKTDHVARLTWGYC